MKKLLPIASVLTLGFFITAFSPQVFAADTTNCTITDLGCLSNDPVQFVQQIFGIGMSVLGLVALLFLIVGGYTILSSQGNPEKLQTGKEYVYYSIAGLLLAFFSFLFVQFIAGSVLKIPGFS